MTEESHSLITRAQHVADNNTRKVVLFALLVAVVLPLTINSFWTRIALGVLMWVGLAQSWNMIGGYTGYLDFGHGVYYGIGGFVTGIAMTSGQFPFLIGIIVAAVVCLVVAYIIGRPTLRLRGAYFAIATWVFAAGIKQLALVLHITGGSSGMSLPTTATSFGLSVPGGLSENFFYYWMLALTLGTTLILYYYFEHHEFGYRVKAVRDDEDAAESLGIDSSKVKRRVYILSCVIAGLFGAVNAYHISFIHPNDLFNPLLTDRMVIMVLVGGLGTIIGPAIGAAVIFLIIRLTPIFFGSSTVYLIIVGLLIMITVLLTPSGIYGVLTGETRIGDVRRNVRELRDKFGSL